MLTARDTLADKIVIDNSDDYLAAFELGELDARLVP